MIRKKLIVIFFLVIDFYSFAQTNVYHQFPTSDAVWRETSGGYQSSNCKDYQYTITGDTVVGIYTYHKIKISGVRYYEDSQGNCTTNVWGYFDNYSGAYRDDTINKKVFFLQSGYVSDTLLYDFDLNIGDLLSPALNNNISWSHNFVSSIDSILVGNEYHKRFGISDTNNFAPATDYVYLIEGIGSTFGLLGYLTPPFESGSMLNCFMQNGIPLYPDTNYQCDLVSLEENGMTSISNLRIYPNPFDLRTEILFDKTYGAINIDVYDNRGRLIRQNEFSNSDKIQFDRNNLNSGLYFLKILIDNKIIVTNKIIVAD